MNRPIVTLAVIILLSLCGLVSGLLTMAALAWSL